VRNNPVGPVEGRSHRAGPLGRWKTKGQSWWGYPPDWAMGCWKTKPNRVGRRLPEPMWGWKTGRVGSRRGKGWDPQGRGRA